MLCLTGLAYVSDVETLRDEERQQEMAAHFVARSLDIRIETYQRMLQSMGQGVHSSMLDSPYVLGLLLREEAGYSGIFDTLVMAGRDGSLVTYAQSGAILADSSALRDALRRTLSDGKPRVAQQQQGEDHLLGLLLTVPLRQADGTVRGALAGLVGIPQQSLLPQQAEGDDTPEVQGQQFMLLDAEGRLLAHSQARDPQSLGSVPQVLRSHGSAWDSLSSTTTSNADTQLWGTLLLTRVGLPLPRWQVVAVRDVSAPLRGMQRLAPWQWLGLIALAVTVALALLGGMEGMRRRLSRLQAQGLWPALPAPGKASAGSSAAESAPLPWPMLEAPPPHGRSPTLQAQESAMVQMLDALPMGAIWARDNALLHATRRAGWLLGCEPGLMVGMTLEQVLQGQDRARNWAVQGMESLMGFGQFRRELVWQQPGGRSVALQVQAMVLQPPELGSLWLLEDAQPLQQARSQTGWQQAYDALTGLANRQTLELQLQTWCAAATTPWHMGLLWVNVDYFSAFNATAGHAAGDEVLRQVAWLLNRERGQEGMAARMEGDAFVLCLRQPQAEGSVQSLAWRLCEVVQAWTPRVGAQCYALSLSVGWLWAEAAGASAPALLHLAETACREAKRQGQGRAVQARVEAEPRSQ
ncbi:MAG: sensor domain-containing diguanylate cyclase [Acidovorax sp.]|jgi:diguanylate cyclase (GGDEF)-like protein|nr:sensor domain-containing diguanylate cyclase [Acidovorax sp.]